MRASFVLSKPQDLKVSITYTTYKSTTPNILKSLLQQSHLKAKVHLYGFELKSRNLKLRSPTSRPACWVQHRMIRAAASSSTSSLKKYDVFLSFRGDDTRTNFTSHLHEALKEKKVETYIDYRLHKGDEISPALIKAIEDSYISIIIFSENYAFSKWCLDELNKILECKKDEGQDVIPVFHNLDPSHVRKQSGSYAQAFKKQEGDSRCNKWKACLTEAANLAGFDSRNRIESEFIKDIVEDVLRKLRPRYQNQVQPKEPVGITESYREIESLLKIRSSKVQMVAIWGMGGIGKTTLAKALYNKLAFREFEVCCFLENVREQSGTEEGLIALRKKLSSDLLGEKNHCFGESPLDMCRIGRKKIFVVLDDVTTSKQLEDLKMEYDDLRPGSIVIITTRDRHILSGDDKIIYEVKELNFNYSLQLFCLNAFKEINPKIGYEDLSKKAISYCKGNPLALKVLGASLRSRSKEAWESRLKDLPINSNVEIHEILKSSYDGLDHSEREIFLDLACFFKGMVKSDVVCLLNDFRFSVAYGIEVLLDKALITISELDTIKMHDLIQEMGWEIVRQESIKDPGRRSRLCDPKEVLDVLKNNKGTEAVEALVFHAFEFEDVLLSSDSFKRMTNLRYLKVYSHTKSNIRFRDGHWALPNELRYLEWHAYSFESLPSTFCAGMLVQLIMPYSNLKKLWDGVEELVNLKKIDLSSSYNLIEIPDLSSALNLEMVNLEYCTSLCRLNPSILSLPELKWLSLEGCKMIETESFKRNFHSKEMINLEYLDLCKTDFESLPANMEELPMLKLLSLHSCEKLVSLPKLPPSLKILSVNNCTSLETIISVYGHKSLDFLSLSNCFNLQLHPFFIATLPFLLNLNAANCTCLDSEFFQQIVLELMLLNLWHKCKHFDGGMHKRDGVFFFPGREVTEKFSFRSAKTSVTVWLSTSALWGFIYCLVLSKEIMVELRGLLDIQWIIKKQGELVRKSGMRAWYVVDLKSDHVLLWYDKFQNIETICDRYNDLSFQFDLLLHSTSGKGQLVKNEWIKGCGINPIYASDLKPPEVILMIDRLWKNDA